MVNTPGGLDVRGIKVFVVFRVFRNFLAVIHSMNIWASVNIVNQGVWYALIQWYKHVPYMCLNPLILLMMLVTKWNDNGF